MGIGRSPRFRSCGSGSTRVPMGLADGAVAARAEDRGVVHLEWSLFALELNSSEAGTPFFEAAKRYGASLVALALARREGGDDAFEAYYAALGVPLHDRGEPISPALSRQAANDVGMPGLVDRALADTSLADEVIAEYRLARTLDVFGVPRSSSARRRRSTGPYCRSPPRVPRPWSGGGMCRGSSRTTTSTS